MIEQRMIRASHAWLKISPWRVLLGIIYLAGAFEGWAQSLIQNENYRLELRNDASVQLSLASGGKSIHFRPSFRVFSANQDPELQYRPASIPGVSYNVVTWKVTQDRLSRGTKPQEAERRAAQAGDGFDDRILQGDTAGRTPNFWSAARSVEQVATAAKMDGGVVLWRFPKHPSFQLEAELTMPKGRAEPVLRYTLRVHQPGFYAVAYTGAPETPPEDANEVWQPLIWQEKRFPDQPYLTLAHLCPLPGAMVARDGMTWSVIADPGEFPFDPLPTIQNSRFGIAVRNAEGAAQPILVAPVLGGLGSKLGAGQVFSFTARLFVFKGASPAAFQQIARTIYGFQDYRRNAISSLNSALENIVDYGMSQFSWFESELKGCAYSTDVPGAVKNVSSLNPLELALVTDNEAIFRERAYPIAEYMLSREKFLFSLDPKQKSQNPSRALKGPCAPLTELTSLYGITHGASPLFLNLAEVEFGRERVRNLDDIERGDSWPNALALYRATGKSHYLQRAIQGADAYLESRIERMQTDFRGPDAGQPLFWTSFAPDWIKLLELYEETREPRHLNAAVAGARRYAMFIWYSPRIPDEEILVNKGGIAPWYWYLQGKGRKPMTAPEERVPAWRLSEIGLSSESSGTSSGHRAIFMANYAPWMLRLGYYAGDAFLRDTARSAVVGRYANFPGYHINTARTTIYEKPDYPLRPHKDLTVNSFHYNHIWPMASMLLDYLVTDAFVRSDGKIDFPSRFIEGYAYLQNKFYGDRPGRFYDSANSFLWMPKGLIDTGTVELNYIAARDDRGLQIALMNQSTDPVRSTIRINPGVAGLAPSSTFEVVVREENKAPRRVAMQKAELAVFVAPKGITALDIRGLTVKPKFQDRLLLVSDADRWRTDFVKLETGDARGMILNFGQGETSAFIYLREDDSKWARVALKYSVDGGAETVREDREYPFEFTLKVPPAARRVDFELVATTREGQVVKEKGRLSR
ncbi:MAG: hypothetical protein FJW35_07885 [Acidobacteria bacterium]|nr:hypothetical protein [Acidobacteriota bacterium]